MSNKRAVIYCRAPSQAGARSSILDQLKELSAYAAERGFRLVGYYAERGSGTAMADRPQFVAMLKSAKKKPKPFDAILVHGIDDFAATREEAVVCAHLLKREHGVEVIFALEPFDIALAGLPLDDIIAAYKECRSIGHDTEPKRRKVIRAYRGEAIGPCPFGFRAGPEGRFVKDPDEAAVVRWIFEEYATGRSGLSSISERLRTEGPSIFGEAATKLRWSPVHVRSIITRPIYMGTFVWNLSASSGGKRKKTDPDEWIVVEGAAEPIVDEDLFNRANRMLGMRKGSRSKAIGDYLLRGMVQCADCGGFMSHYKMRSKDSFRSHLSCTRYHHSRKCYFNHVDMADLEQTILRALRKALREDDAGKDPGEAEASGPSPAVLASAIETAADTGLPVAERRAALRGVLREVRFSKKRGCLELVLNHGDLAGVTTSVDLSG